MSTEGATKILVVDDSPEFVELLSATLRGEGFEVASAEDGEAGVEQARGFDPDVIVLDLGLPKLDGIEVCRQLRTFSDAYVVMLTARSDEVDKLIGLSVGADDYVTKPVSPRELVARVRAMMRRPRSAGVTAGAERSFGELEIDTDSREVSLRGEKVELTRIEFDLLATLSARPKVVFSRALLLEKIWGPRWFGDDHVVDVHIAELRKKIGDDPKQPRYIKTVRGVGYRMVDGADRRPG